MKKFAETIERLLAWGGIKKDIVFLVISGAALAASLSHISKLPFDPAWIAILLCGVPILMEAFVGLITSFDIKADVLVSLALIASVLIGHGASWLDHPQGLYTDYIKDDVKIIVHDSHVHS